MTNENITLTERETFWLAKGYVSARIAAIKTKRSKHTVYRAIQAGELTVIKDGKTSFILTKSLVEWIGVETAVAYGLIKK